MFLAASLIALTMPAAAQGIDSVTPKTPAGTAVKHATGKAAKHSHHQSSAAHASKHKTAPTIKNVGHKTSTAHFQTGQLATSQAAHSKQTPEESGQAPDQSSKNTNVLRLKKHNARMF